ncbi:tripartite motif-containing protein 59-like [Penaeus indicus]|uniref:tripartite motif-containing protein 59-like n=1 Tax=Penaeus indicus TaxID=29960 RepID=UPI00300CC955
MKTESNRSMQRDLQHLQLWTPIAQQSVREPILVVSYRQRDATCVTSTDPRASIYSGACGEEDSGEDSLISNSAFVSCAYSRSDFAILIFLIRNSRAMDCRVCYNPFDDKDYRPRNLECGHSFCTSCLKGIHYGSTLECPECRHQQTVEEVAALPVGFGVLRAVEAARGEITSRKEQDEWEAPLFILPSRKKDLQEGGKESLENEGAADLEALKKSYRNVLWSRIYFCAEKLEELKDYERTLRDVSGNVRQHVHCLEKILENRQSLTQSLQAEAERCQREQESIEGRKKELFVRKEQLNGASGLEDTEDFCTEEYIDRQHRLNNFLKMDKESLAQLRSFTTHMCRNDKRLCRILESLDVPESDLIHLFDDMLKLN